VRLIFAIISLGTDGLITDWNSGAERTLGWTAGEIFGQPADHAGVEMRCSLAEGSATDELWHLKKDGTRFWTNGELMPLQSVGLTSATCS